MHGVQNRQFSYSFEPRVDLRYTQRQEKCVNTLLVRWMRKKIEHDKYYIIWVFNILNKIANLGIESWEIKIAKIQEETFKK